MIVIAAVASTLALQWGGLAREEGRQAPAAAGTQLGARETPPAAARGAPTRDLFVFGDDSDLDAAPEAVLPGATHATEESGGALTEPTPEPRARLVGFLRKGGRVSAVLSLDGAVEVVAVDEERRGYRVLAIDEDTGSARLRSPEGETVDVGAPAAR
jgi:hypothetical protein